jgi:hypothetical protein
MPEYSLIYDDTHPMPIFVERYIDDISYLKEGDYLFSKKRYDDCWVLTAHNITKITNKWIFIEKLEWVSDSYKQKEIRLTWKEINPEEITSLSKGYLNNSNYKTTFHFYVKKEDMDINIFDKQ